MPLTTRGGSISSFTAPNHYHLVCIAPAEAEYKLNLTDLVTEIKPCITLYALFYPATAGLQCGPLREGVPEVPSLWREGS